MMMINLHALPRMVILPILALLFITHPTSFIHCTPGNPMSPVGGGVVELVNAGFLRGMLRKTPIDIDISRDAPRGIMVIPHDDVPTCNIYTVDELHYDTHKIGAILDGNIMVLGDNNRSIDRTFYLYNEHDGMRIVRISDFVVTGDRMQRDVVELMRLPGEPSYEPLVRLPVNIDLPEEGSDWVSVQRDQDSGVITYAIRPEFRYRTIIGMVRYGGLVVDNRLNEDVLEREVTLRPDGENPEILVTSHMKDGSKVNARYLFRNGNNGGVIVPTMTEVLRLPWA